MERQVRNQPKISVGIVDRQAVIEGRLNGNYSVDDSLRVSGPFSAKATGGLIALTDGASGEICRSPRIRLISRERSTFSLRNVTIGQGFHWEQEEEQTFQGDLILRLRQDETVAAVNEIPLEDYLSSVIASEMNPAAPEELLKAHAILSRSWLLVALERKNKTNKRPLPPSERVGDEKEIIRWYEREDHDLFDVCADDHCQRYRGVTAAASKQAGDAVRKTRGMAIVHGGRICDARYSKACGGITEEFATAWNDAQVPYLRSVSDSPGSHSPVRSEEDARRWIHSEPDCYCNTKDRSLLETILPASDRPTGDFFRWKVECSRTELESILFEKSGVDLGTLREILPLERGPSGRIFRLQLVGSKKTLVVGKELEIRRWLSRSHLYSSAFTVTVNRNSRGEPDRFILHGAGWGHGVGLCQIGAAVMAGQGFSAERILKHYFKGVEIGKIYAS